MAIEMTPNEPGTKDLSTMVIVHLGRTFSAQNQTTLKICKKKTKSFSDYLTTLSGTLSLETLSSGIDIELLRDEHYKRHFPATGSGGAKIRVSVK